MYIYYKIFLKVVNLTNKLEKEKHFNDDLNDVIANMTNCINELKTTLKSTSNELTGANKTIEEQHRHITELECELDLTRKSIEKLKHHIVEISAKDEVQNVDKTNDCNNLTNNKQQSIFQPVMGTISI